VNKWKPLKSK